MSRDKLLELAKKAGLNLMPGHLPMWIDNLERFAALLSEAQELEAALYQHRKPICGNDGEVVGYSDWQDGKGLDHWPHRALYAAPPSSDQVRNEALEEAEKACTDNQRNDGDSSYDMACRDCVKLVRSLKRPSQAQEPKRTRMDDAIEHGMATLIAPANPEPAASGAGDELTTLPQSLLDLIGEYGMARTDGVGKLEIQHRWLTLIGGIKDYARSVSALSRAQHAAPGGWKLMPPEASDEMLTAVRKPTHFTRPDGWDSVHAKLYKAMFAAAPSTQPQGGGNV